MIIIIYIDFVPSIQNFELCNLNNTRNVWIFEILLVFGSLKLLSHYHKKIGSLSPNRETILMGSEILTRDDIIAKI